MEEKKGGKKNCMHIIIHTNILNVGGDGRVAAEAQHLVSDASQTEQLHSVMQ